MQTQQSRTELEHYAYQSARFSSDDLAVIEREFAKKAGWYSCFLKGILPSDKRASIVDVPCGHGNFLWFARHAGYSNVKGYDIDPGRVAIARKLGLDAEIADASVVLAESAHSIDVLACLDFLEHLDKSEVPAFLTLCHSALRSGGKMLVRMPCTDSFRGGHDLWNDFTHKWAANSGVYRMMFEQAGFTEIMIKDERPVLYKPLNYLRLAAFYLAKSLTNLYLAMLGTRCNVWSSSIWIIARKAGPDALGGGTMITHRP